MTRPVPRAPGEFRAGQVWRYRTREKEPASTVMVLAVDDDIVHVFIEHLDIEDPLLDEGVVSILSIPVDRLALEASVLELLREDLTAPEFVEAHRQWTELYEEGDRSKFSEPLTELLDLTEESLVQRALEGGDEN